MKTALVEGDLFFDVDFPSIKLLAYINTIWWSLLQMFAIPPNGYKTTDNLEGRRHCILVAASNPFPFPVPVCRPNIDNCGDPLPAHDAVSVAGWFSQV